MHKMVEQRRLGFAVLGPLRVWIEGEEPLDITPRGLRAVLAVLLLGGNQPVPRDQIIDAVWGEQPPATATNIVHQYIARLRRRLEPRTSLTSHATARRLASTAGGYLLHVEEDELDALRFRRLTEQARQLRADGAAERALATLETALGLWRGACLADLDGAIRSHAEVVALERQWQATVLELADLALGLARYDRAIPHLEAVVARDPLHEGFHVRLMVALAGAGRQAAALELYERIRRRLAEELGIDPGSELRAAHQRVLRQQVASAAVPEPAPRAAVAAPAQLPAGVLELTGRDRELAWLRRLLERRGDGASAPPVVTITGLAGIGKTALATHAGHQLTAGFPDGQLFADLHGSGPRPAAAGEVLGGFLRALGVTAAELPAGEEERAALYRTLLAGRRMLVLLDDARDAAQVRPLLPGSPGCGVLITSRRRLTGVTGTRPLDLGTLDTATGTELLDRLAGQARVATEPTAAAAVVSACGGLPLALRIAAARLAARPGWTVRILADLLADPHRRLDELELEDLSVRASFQACYLGLDPQQRRAFRLVGLIEGSQIALPAAAALLDLPSEQAHTLLEHLVDVHLLEFPTPDRYAMHPLLRLFAAEQGGIEEPEA